MKLIYVANSRLPTEKAHGIQIVRTCEALKALDVDLELWLPRRRNEALSSTDLFTFYKIKNNFAVRYLWCWDLIGILDFLPGAGYFVQSRTFAWSVNKMLKKTPRIDAIYSRDLSVLKSLLKFKIPYFYEAHTFPEKLKTYHLRVLRQARGIISISKNLALQIAKFVFEGKIVVAGDGVDLSLFGQDMQKKDARRQLGFSLSQKIVLYTGHLYEWKGVHILAQAAEQLPRDVDVLLIGGTEADLQKFRDYLKSNRLERVKLLGHIPQNDIPKYLAASDVLVLPNSGKSEISRLHTSPLKLFEYMASHRPIVSSDLPSLREVIDETSAYFFIPEDPVSLARRIRSVFSDPGLAERIAVNAAKKVRAYTWDKRAKKIRNFIVKQLEYNV